jgi:HEAT repeats
MDIPADPVLVDLLERATTEALRGSARESEIFWATVREAVDAVPVDEVLAVGITFCRADVPAMRATGAAALAELGNVGPEWVVEVLDELASLLAREREPDVVRIALHGIALTGLERGAAISLPYASDPDARVRLDATHALYSCAGEPASTSAIGALIRLSNDHDDAVRDWATFGLGTQIAADDEHIRGALVARLDDAFLDVREEAVVGLARRRDSRAFEPVRTLLASDEVSAQTVEASGYLADERLLRPLLELGEWWEDDSDVLRLAIARCDPVARERFDERTRELLELIERGFEESAAARTLERVRAERSSHDLTSDLIVRITDASGAGREQTWSIEDLFARPEVRDDPARAAAAVLADL